MSKAERAEHKRKMEAWTENLRKANLAKLDPKDNPESDEYVSPGPLTPGPTASPFVDLMNYTDEDRKRFENMSEWCWRDDGEYNWVWIPKGTIRVTGKKEKTKCLGDNEQEVRGAGCCNKIPEDW
ncbi:uncharacterized protein LOC134820348 [Bolinopsis microptera]|uniref:uncharacterized protein LOC134820348 n=1 Tax=Bolinopsis microptera TaxID=2820187 RepID=UPI003078BD7A